MKDWFEDWFDSPYYHILYKHRDYSEAEIFMENLKTHFAINQGSKILDLACGKGRHSVYLNKLGFDLMGVDLSENSIVNAKRKENETLKFQTMDMRNLSFDYQFDYIFNLFTSFGYFNSREENLKVLQSVEKNLKNDGVFVLDYMNANKVMMNLVEEEEKLIDDILFEIRRSVKGGQIVKNIDFDVYGRKYSFKEQVQALTLTDFQSLFKETNLEIVDYFGNYNLDLFDPKKSERLIIVAKKQS